MSEARKDTERAQAAVRAIVADRGFADAAAIMVTAEHAVAALLLVLYGTPERAAAMLNEALVPGIEERIARGAARARDRNAVEAGDMALKDYIEKWGDDT